METQTQSTLQLSTSHLAPRVLSGWTAETIRIARKAKELTQMELAFALGCRQQTISEWELAMYTPKNAYQKLLDLYFKAKEGGVTQDESAAPSPVSVPAAGGSFIVTREQLLGTLKYMEMNQLGEMQIAFHNAQQTFEIFGTEEKPAVTPARLDC